jgi:hypothetical protein
MDLDEARQALLLEHGWIPETLAIWLRADCRCEVCGRDLLGTTDDYFYGAEIDHLQPATRGGSDELSNRALLCRMCNRLKRNTELCDPAVGLPREEVLELARKYILPIRRQRQQKLDDAKRLLSVLRSTSVVVGCGPGSAA